MCGVHNNTKDLTVQHLHSFVMKEAPDSSEGAVIDHLSVSQIGKPYCAAIYFLNVSIVNITNLTMRCPSIQPCREPHYNEELQSLWLSWHGENLILH